MKSQKLVSLGLAAVVVTAIAAGSLAFQDGSDTSASALGLTDSQVQQIAYQAQATPDEEREAYLQKIADNLGVDLARLKEAIGQANIATLDEKVADGTIPQERADAMRERLASGDGFFMGGKGPGGPGHRGPGGFGVGPNAEALAEFFGIDLETLRTEMQTKSLATIASETGKSVDDLKALLASGIEEKLAEKVAAGSLTQEEADAKLAEFRAHLEEEINEVHAHGPRGPRPEMAPTN